MDGIISHEEMDGIVHTAFRLIHQGLVPIYHTVAEGVRSQALNV